MKDRIGEEESDYFRVKDIKKFLANKNLLSVQIGGNFSKNIDTKNFLKNISEDDMKILLFKIFKIVSETNSAW